MDARRNQRLLHVENHVHHQLVLRSFTPLRTAVGAIFLGFGVLNHFLASVRLRTSGAPHRLTVYLSRGLGQTVRSCSPRS